MSSQETHKESSTDARADKQSRTVLACPECDSSDIRTNNNGLQGCKAAADHVCRDCGNAFSDAEAVRRQPKRSVTTPPSIARNLENANPEDVGKPMTDGGHEPDYDCRHCDWAGDECDRREHYPVCPNCSRIVKVRQELVADGGVPETFDDLASTCEHCGDDVDPERLIEGECPGCHYRPVADGGVELEDIGTVVSSTRFEGDRFALETAEACVVFEFMSPALARATAETLLPDGYQVVEEPEPMADGGFHTVIRNGQEFAVVRQQEFADDAELDIDPSGRIRNYDEIEKEIVVRLLSVDAIAAQELENRVISPGDHDWEAEYADLELGERVVVEDELTADGGIAWTDLTGFKRDLLEAIRRLDNDGETTYGLAIKREVERVYGEDIHHGRLYPNLDDLVDAGLIEKGQLDRRTNEYQLTSEAEAMLEQRVRLLADACGLEQPVADGGEQQ